METVFVKTFGETPYIKVLDFFLTYKAFDYSKTQVAAETGVSRITMEKIWPELKLKKLIKETRNIGRAELCQLNTANPVVRELLQLDFNLSKAIAEQENILTVKSGVRR